MPKNKGKVRFFALPSFGWMDGWVSPTKSLSAATAQGSREDFRSPGVRSGNIGTDGDALQGGKNRRRGKNENDREKRELTFKEDGQGSLHSLARSLAPLGGEYHNHHEYGLGTWDS